jgi:hypothetical protein
MARSFVLETLLRLKDDFSTQARASFAKVEKFGLKAAGTIGQALTSSFVKLTALGGGAAAGFGLFKVAEGFQEVAKEMSRVERMARATNLDPQFLAGLENALSAKGVENIDEVGRAIEEFFLRLTELQQKNPTGELYSNLKDIGANDVIKQFKQTTDATEQLKLALTLIATEKDQAKKIRLADSIFGGSDQALDLRRIAGTREELAGVFSSVDDLAGATNEQFQAASRLADAQAKLGARWTAAKQTLVGGLAPAIAEQLDKLAAWAEANKELINSRLEAFVRTLADAIQRLIALPWGQYLEQAKRGFDVLVAGVQVAIRDAKIFLTIFGVAKLAQWGKAVGSAMGKAASDIVTFSQRMTSATGRAYNASKLLSAALRFAGPIGAALSLADVLGTVITQLTGIEDFAARNTKADIGGLAGAKRTKAEGLQAETVLLERLVDTGGTGLAPGKLGADPEIMQRFQQLVEETGSAEAALEEARRRARANREAVRDLLAEADVVESEAERRVQERAEQRAAAQIQQVDAPGGALLAATLPQLQATLVRVQQAVETQTQALRDQRFAPNTGAR